MLSFVGNDTDWAFSFGNNLELHAEGMVVAPNGNLLVSGRFNGTLNFDPTGTSPDSTLESGPSRYNATSSTDAYLASYHADGTVAWVRHVADSEALAWARGVTTDGEGNIFVTGSYRRSTKIGDDFFPRYVDGTPGYLIKYDPEGQPLWVRSWDVAAGNHAVVAKAVAVAPSGNIYVAGEINGVGYFDTLVSPDPGPCSAFLLKLDEYGNAQWVWRANANSEIYRITVGEQVDASGNAYEAVTAAGRFLGSPTWPSLNFGPNLTLTPAGEDDIFVAQFSGDAPAPSCVWARRMGGAGVDYVGDLALAPDGSLYFTGAFSAEAVVGSVTLISAGESDTFVTKLDSSDGEVLWAGSMGGTRGEDASPDELLASCRITVDGDGGVYVAGAFWSDTIDVEPTDGFTLLHKSGDLIDSYVLQLSEDGEFRQAWHLPVEPAGPGLSESLTLPFGMAFRDGYVLVTGWLRGTGHLPPGSLTSFGTDYPDVYLLRFDTTAQTPNSPPAANDDAYECQKIYSVTVPKMQGVLANDGNADLDPLRATLLAGPTKGTLALNLDGSFTYTPNPGTVNEQDSFQYAVDDGRGGTSTGTVTIAITEFKPVTYASTDVPRGIVDLSNRVTVSQLVVDPPSDYLIGDLDVGVSFTHPRAPDLDVFLIAPDGTRVELFTDVGGSKSAFTGKITVLDEEATVSITKGDTPFAGSYRPEGKLSVLKGKSIVGTWKLEIVDDQPKQVGTLNSWFLTFTPKDPYAALHVEAAAPGNAAAPLTSAKLQPLLEEALSRWQASGMNVSALAGLSVQIADLGGTTLGLAAGNTIWLDDDAAGWGWFVDATPHDDREFLPHARADAQQRIDLLTVVLHEMGHLLGREHAADGLMAETLATGARRSVTNDPHAAAVDHWFAQSLDLRAGGWLSDWLTEQLQPKRAWSRNRR